MTASGEGEIRLYKSDSGNTYKIPIFFSRTEPLDVATDPRQLPFVGQLPITLKEDDKLLLAMKGDAATVVDNTSVIRVPIQVKNTSSGFKYDTDLTAADFGLTSADVNVATTETIVGSYTVPAQMEIRIGKGNAVNSSIYMQLAYT